jgi:hypothetical protein
LQSFERIARERLRPRAIPRPKRYFSTTRPAGPTRRRAKRRPGRSSAIAPRSRTTREDDSGRLDIWLHIGRWHPSHRMPQRLQLAGTNDGMTRKLQSPPGTAATSQRTTASNDALAGGGLPPGPAASMPCS